MTARSINNRKEAPEVEILLEFLQRTKDGTYATIERTSLQFSRTGERTHQDAGENLEHYYYGVS